MNRIKNNFILCIILLTVFLTYKHAYGKRILTLQECLSLALKNNDALTASLSSIEMKKQETKISYSEFFPKLKSKVQYTLFDKEPSFIIEKNAFAVGIPPADTELPAGAKDTYAFTLSVEQPIFTGGYLTSTYEKAIIKEKESEMLSENTKNKIILSVKTAYFDMLKTIRIKESAEQALRLKEEHRRITEKRYNEGLSIKEEQLLLNASISKQKLELLKINNDITIKGKTLKNLTGVASDEEIEVADELENKKLAINLIESKDLAVKNRKDLEAFHYSVRASEKEIKVAESNLYPKGFISGSTVTLNWDIFEWGKTKADVKRAKAGHERLSTEYSALKKDVMLDVEQKWFKVKEAEEEVNVTEDRFIHAEERYKNTLLKHRENLIKASDVLDAETYLLQSKNEYINSIYNIEQRMAEFEFSVSSDITPFITKEKIHRLSAANSYPNPKVDIKTQAAAKQESKLKQLPARIRNTSNKDIPKSLEKNSGITDTAAEADFKYIIQSGAFKHVQRARGLLKRLKSRYPASYIVMEDSLNKVRIPGVKSKEDGDNIIKVIKEDFGIDSILLKL
ncbi:MAG: TolC family protein [Nitrospirae bacterium]|nr:TolC family protein [Nitrospirota bacterium]